MTKAEFLHQLQENLNALSEADRDERIQFFGELIDDKIEAGLGEEDAVREIGDPVDIANQITAEFNTPSPEPEQEAPKVRRKLKGWEITLISIGSPIWGSIAIAVAAVIFSLYASLWAVVVSLWAADLAFALGSVAGTVAFFPLLFSGNLNFSLLVLGSGLVSGALSMLMFYPCKYLTHLSIKLTKLFFGRIGRTSKKEANKQ